MFRRPSKFELLGHVSSDEFTLESWADTAVDTSFQCLGVGEFRAVSELRPRSVPSNLSDDGTAVALHQLRDFLNMPALIVLLADEGSLEDC